MPRTTAADTVVEGASGVGVAAAGNPVVAGYVDASGNVQYAGAGALNGAIVLQASLTDPVAHTVAGTPVTGLGSYKQIQIELNVTAASAASGDTLDVYIDASLDGGTTWINAVHFPQVLGNGGAKSFVAVLDPGGAPPATTTATTSDCAVGVVRPNLFPDRLKVRYVIAGTGSFTFAVPAYAKS